MKMIDAGGEEYGYTNGVVVDIYGAMIEKALEE